MIIVDVSFVLTLEVRSLSPGSAKSRELGVKLVSAGKKEAKFSKKKPVSTIKTKPVCCWSGEQKNKETKTLTALTLLRPEKDRPVKTAGSKT